MIIALIIIYSCIDHIHNDDDDDDAYSKQVSSMSGIQTDPMCIQCVGMKLHAMKV